MVNLLAVQALRASTPRSAAKLGTLDDFLTEEGRREDVEAVAVKEVLAWQIAEAMRKSDILRTRLAERMKTAAAKSVVCTIQRTAT